MELTLQQRLELPFPPSMVSWRIGAKSQDKRSARLLAYIDARDAMERLDSAVGFGLWQCKYSLSDAGLLICDVGLKIDGEWVWRANGAGDTQVEAEKGKCSDAFKRAAVLWGIGRYLYGLDSPWVAIDDYGKWSGNPKLPKWATPDGYLEGLRPTDDPSWQQVPEAEHKRLRDIIKTAREYLSQKEYKEAWLYLERQNLPVDEKTCVWSGLTYNMRVALKVTAETISTMENQRG